MAKKKKNEFVPQEKKLAPKRQIPLKRALSVWRKNNPQIAMLLGDDEAVSIYTKRFIPSLVASQEDFNTVFMKF